MKNLRAFKVRFLPWTETKPSRVKITDTRKNVSVVISAEKRYIHDDAFLYLQRQGIICDSMVEMPANTFLLLTDDFSTSIK